MGKQRRFRFIRLRVFDVCSMPGAWLVPFDDLSIPCLVELIRKFRANLIRVDITIAADIMDQMLSVI
jgi:hypothetical protein